MANDPINNEGFQYETDRGDAYTNTFLNDDDKGSPQPPQLTTSDTPVSYVQSGSTQAGRAGNSASSNQTPGVRLKNPLGDFSSYTHNTTLYMATPSAYNAFIATGRANINSLGKGVYIVAQSGGVNNTTSERAPGFELDYYLDDLKITQIVNGKASRSFVNMTDMTFNIYEPYGCSFLSKLRQAGDAMVQNTQGTPYEVLKDPTRQFFILGIRFYGYDANGKIIGSSPNGLNSTGNGMYERFFPIMIKEIKFKLDGKLTVYRCSACSVGLNAFDIKKGRIDKNTSFVAQTVGDALHGLESFLNNQQELLFNQGTITQRTNYKFVCDPQIENAKLVNEADLNKLKFPHSPAKTINDVTPHLELTCKPTTTKRTIQIKDDSSIIESVGLFITQSTYILDALKVIYTNVLEQDPNSNKDDEYNPNTNDRFRWFNIRAEISNVRTDKKINDYAYDITYIIEKYQTPAINSPYIKTIDNYYGPVKKYEYWFSGKNTELLRYEQVLDNTYYQVTLGPGSPDVPNSDPLVPNKQTDESKLNKTDRGSTAQNMAINWLLDTKSRASAKITILGDPDFLMVETAGTVNTVYRKFYADDGFTINPSGGQVFIEISFFEGIDYNNESGTLNINDRLVLWAYPPSLQSRLKSSISYLVTTCTSIFKGGQFTQELSLVIVPFTERQQSSDNINASRDSSTLNTSDTTPAVGLMQNTEYSTDNDQNYSPPMIAQSTDNPEET